MSPDGHLLVQLRQELGLPLDETAFAKASKAASDRTVAALDALIAGVKRQLSGS
jgi:hypothetical protein